MRTDPGRRLLFRRGEAPPDLDRRAAERLSVSLDTAVAHGRGLIRKFGVRSRSEVVIKARAEGLLADDAGPTGA